MRFVFRMAGPTDGRHQQIYLAFLAVVYLIYIISEKFCWFENRRLVTLRAHVAFCLNKIMSVRTRTRYVEGFSIVLFTVVRLRQIKVVSSWNFVHRVFCGVTVAFHFKVSIYFKELQWKLTGKNFGVCTISISIFYVHMWQFQRRPTQNFS